MSFVFDTINWRWRKSPTDYPDPNFEGFILSLRVKNRVMI